MKHRDIGWQFCNRVLLGFIGNDHQLGHAFGNEAVRDLNHAMALGPLALAFCGASDKETIAKIQQLQKKFGPEWIHPYLASRGLRLADYTVTTTTP